MSNKGDRVTIQLSAKALESIIGQDTEAQVDLRNTIVQNFAQRHIKCLANSDELRNAVRSELRWHVERLLREEVGTEDHRKWYGDKCNLSADMIRKIKDQADMIVLRTIDEKLAGERDAIMQRISEEFATIKVYVDNTIKDLIPRATNDEIERRVSERLRAIAQATQNAA